MNIAKTRILGWIGSNALKDPINIEYTRKLEVAPREDKMRKTRIR